MGKVRGIEVKHTTLILADRWGYDRHGRLEYPCPCCGVKVWFTRESTLEIEASHGRSYVTTKTCPCFEDQLLELEDFYPFPWADTDGLRADGPEPGGGS